MHDDRAEDRAVDGVSWVFGCSACLQEPDRWNSARLLRCLQMLGPGRLYPMFWLNIMSLGSCEPQPKPWFRRKKRPIKL